MRDFDNRLNAGWWVLRIGLGVGPIITGIDKYFDKLADWGMYLSPLATKVVPISATNFMHVVAGAHRDGAVPLFDGNLLVAGFDSLGPVLINLDGLAAV